MALSPCWLNGEVQELKEKKGDSECDFQQGCVKCLTLPWKGYGSAKHLKKRSTFLGRGNRKRQSESEYVALERMSVVYLLQASASVSNE
ncbi:hypothetical protein EVAR_11647_1 [Eumeta japonica]|uniref:Uncharacterized protein n=1 Tax=Eumeta variegata TaxID=151549 RepID=A0A4C1WXV2_EUMVA|nr:hypothetical protein EVAR_11647_1 [Eumeta japonica]